MDGLEIQSQAPAWDYISPKLCFDAGDVDLLRSPCGISESTDFDEAERGGSLSEVELRE